MIRSLCTSLKVLSCLPDTKSNSPTSCEYLYTFVSMDGGRDRGEIEQEGEGREGEGEGERGYPDATNSVSAQFAWTDVSSANSGKLNETGFFFSFIKFTSSVHQRSPIEDKQRTRGEGGEEEERGGKKGYHTLRRHHCQSQQETSMDCCATNTIPIYLFDSCRQGKKRAEKMKEISTCL